MAKTPEMEEEPPQVRLLRRLSMALIVVLILGFLTIVAVIVIRLGFPPRGEPVTAAQLKIGVDAEIIASGQGPGTVHLIVRTPDGRETLMVFDARSGATLSHTSISRN